MAGQAALKVGDIVVIEYVDFRFPQAGKRQLVMKLKKRYTSET